MSNEGRFGIEEEYFLADAVTRGIGRKVSAAFIEAAQRAFPEEVQREMLQSQIEVATPICRTMDEARRSLTRLRTGLAGLALEHDMLLLACGTHPSAAWSRQRATEAARYDTLMRDLQMLGSRNQLCGLHVHVEVADEDERIRLMARIMPFLPVILALSTSSPFWQGRRTGLMGYRLAAYGELPRTGLPDLFADPADYGPISTPWLRPARSRMAAISGGRSDPPTSIRPWSCASPIPARGWTIPSPSPRSTAVWCAISCAIPG